MNTTLPPIYYDNIIFSLQDAGGISRYWVELVRRLRQENGVHFYESPNTNTLRREISLEARKESSIPTFLLRYIPFRARIRGPAIFHSSYFRYSSGKSVVNVVTVHDFTYEKYRKGTAKYLHTLQKKNALKNAHGIICVSHNTRQDLCKAYPTLRKALVSVIHLSAGAEFRPLCNAHQRMCRCFPELVNAKFLLYVGDRAGYKNFKVATELVHTLGDLCLVMVGGPPLTFQEKKKLHGVAHKVFHFTSIASTDLNILYNNAFCLLYPSDYEGFGLPVLEAMKSGCPVVASNRASIPEISGGACLLVETNIAEHYSWKISMLRDSETRNAVKHSQLKQASKFSWDRCFRSTIGFYREVCAMNQHKGGFLA